MEDENKKNKKIIKSSHIKENHPNISSIITSNLDTKNKNNPINQDISEPQKKNKTTSENINGIPKIDFFDINLFSTPDKRDKKLEISNDNLTELNNRKNQKELNDKKIYLYLRKNLENPSPRTRNINYSPQITPRKKFDIFGSQSDDGIAYNNINYNNNFFSVSIDTTSKKYRKKENNLKNNNKMHSYNLDIDKNTNKENNIENKIVDKIIVPKERDNFFNKLMKSSISHNLNKNNNNVNMIKADNSPNVNKIPTKKSDVNKNKNDLILDSHKNKKPIKDDLPKNNNVIKRQKLNEKQKIINTHQNKEKNKPLKRKEKPIFSQNNHQTNIIIYDNKEKETNKKDININNIIKSKRIEKKITNITQIKKQNNIKDKNKIIKNGKNNNKSIKINDTENNIDKNKNQENNNNIKDVKEIEINLNKKENNESINESKNNLYNENNFQNDNIINENLESINIGKNIIIKRDLSNRNNNLIYISKNNDEPKPNKLNTIIQSSQNNNSIFISNHCKNNQNKNCFSNIYFRKSSENLPNTKINLNNEINKTNFKDNNSSKNVVAYSINNTDIKNKNSDNSRIISIYQNKNYDNEKFYLSRKNNKNENIISNNISQLKRNNEQNNENENIIKNNIGNNNIVSQIQNNYININIEVKPKKEIISKNNIKIKNHDTNKLFDKANNNKNNNNNIQYKVNKINRQNRSLINKRENKNIINIKPSYKNSSSKIILNKNDIFKNNKNMYDTYNITSNQITKNNISPHLKANKKQNKKPNKIIIQNVVIENNATNNNIFFSNNIISPNNYLINSIKEPIVQNEENIYHNNFNNNYFNSINKYNETFTGNYQDNLFTTKSLNTSDIHRNVIYPLNDNKFSYYNIDNIDNLNYTTRKPNMNNSTRININEIKEIKENKIMNSTMTNPSTQKKIMPYAFHRSNSDHLSNSAGKILSSDKKSSSQLITLEDSIKEDRIKNLKGSCKSLLSDCPRIKCPICSKLIQSHLLQIHINAHPSKVFDWLYLGTFTNACDIEELRRMNIKYILNCAIECKNNTLPKDIKELHLKIRDNVNFDIIPFFKQSNEFINQVRSVGGKILIHCKLGISRSAAIVIAYLIKYYGFNFNSALKFIKKQRDRINPNAGFIELLKQYEKKSK